MLQSLYMKWKFFYFLASCLMPISLTLISCSTSISNDVKEVNLKKDNFSISEFGLTDQLLENFNPTLEWVFLHKEKIFNNSELITNKTEIKNLNISKENKKILINFKIFEKNLSFRIDGFKENNPSENNRYITLKKNLFSASEFNLANTLVSNFEPDDSWIFNNKSKIFNNDDLIDNKNKITSISKEKIEQTKISISFNVISTNVSFQIEGFKSNDNKLTLKKNDFDISEFNLDKKSESWMIKVDNSFIWKNKNKIFNNSEMISSDLSIKDVTEKNINSERKKIVSFTIDLSKFSIKIVNFSQNKPFIQNQINDSIQSGNKLRILGTYYRKLSINNDRKLNTQKYETKLSKDNNFKYPGFNYDYKKLNLIDFATKVMDERVDFQGLKVKYNDENWIKSEIENNRFKRHPAANTFYVQNFDSSYMDSAKSVNADFEIVTSMTGTIPLGLYAPPGEIITLELSQETFDMLSKINQMNALSIDINTNYWDNREVGNSGQISNRYPYINTIFSLDKNSKTLQFGSPFGGSISLVINENLIDYDSSFYKKFNGLRFNVNGAIESFVYIHGVTTVNEWNSQIEKIKNKSIASPVFSSYFTFASMNIPFTWTNTIGGKIDAFNLEYPIKTFDKWFEFLNLSNYYSDKTNILNMKFCDDIWDSAAAFGGGNILYAPLEWGANSFLTGLDGFNSISGSWGVFHEINHNFEQNRSLFKKRDHFDTNQLSIAELSLLSDAGRWRNPYNVNSEFIFNDDEIGWTRLGNSYFNILNQDSKDWRLFSSILYTLGTYNYINYVKWDSYNHPNTEPNWEGLDEIRVLSNFFKLNFWPTFNKFTGYRDWLDSEANANEEQKKMLQEISEYPAIDFVGNFYASGIYFYDSISKEFKYTNDVISPYEIPAGSNYTFDFDKFINSTNSEFEWDNLEFSQSKNGATISFDPKNNKKIIYSPKKDKVDDIDEFDISITPKKWTGRVDNYVPKYKWKIKVRQVVNRPILNVFSINENDKIEDKFKKMETEQPIYSGVTKLFNSSKQIFEKNSKLGINIKYKFVAPKNGKYVFYFKTNDYAKVKIIKDGSTLSTLNFGEYVSQNYPISLNKNDSIDFNAFVIWNNVSWNPWISFNSNASVNNENIDLNNNILITNINEFSDSVDNYLNNSRYQYKSRNVNNSLLNRNLGQLFNFSEINFGYKKDEYDLIYDEKLNFNNSIFEGSINNLKEINNKNNFIVRSSNNGLTIDLEFKQISKIYSILIGNENTNYSKIIPTNIKIISLDENYKEQEIMFNGKYENNNKGDFNSIQFSKEFSVKRIRIFLENKEDNFIGLSWILPMQYRYSILNNIISMTNNSSISFKGSWKEKLNDLNGNMSSVNNSSILSETINDEIEFIVSATGFNIIGQKNNLESKFDLYVDDKLIAENISTLANNKEFNSNLYTYLSNNFDAKPMKVKIVHKDKNPLYINYIQTYGNNVSIF